MKPWLGGGVWSIMKKNSFLLHGLMNVHVICRYLIIENFIPPEEKTKLMNRAVYDEDEDVWILRPLANKK